MLIKFHNTTQDCYFCKNSAVKSIVEMKINLSGFLLKIGSLINSFLEQML